MKSRSIRCENFASPFRQGASKGRGSTAADNASALASGLSKKVWENYQTIMTESDHLSFRSYLMINTSKN